MAENVKNLAYNTLKLNALLSIVLGVALLLVGGWLYITCRPGTLIYVLFRECVCATGKLSLPDFVIYNLPGGLWSLAYVLIMHPILRAESRSWRIALVSVIPVLGIVSELLQAAGCLPGTFDALDMLCYCLPIIIYLILQNKKPLNYEKEC